LIETKLVHFYHIKIQRSTLSPLLFDIYLRVITKYLHHDSHILLYADDITVYSTSRNPLEAFYSVQTSLDRISVLRNRGLDLSPEKSQWMIFTRNKTVPCLPALKIFGSSPKVTTVKFLEIFLDSKMSEREHLKYLIRKESEIVDILSSLAGIWWSSHSLLLNLYRSIFRDSIECGCQIFQLNLNKSIFIKLKRLQYRAIRIAMSYRISMPINVTITTITI